jgi:2-phosphosulfolactate phosphatase
VNIDLAWGRSGLRALIESGCDEVVVVDVLRFTTAVDVAVSRGAEVYPYRWHDGTEHAYAAERHATVAVRGSGVDERHPWSLSPARLATIPAGTKLVLPSPNGARLSFEAADEHVGVTAGCLRNARAVARYVAEHGERIGVLAAGERWGDGDGPLRPAVEDVLGAGAIVHALDPSGSVSSPDAIAAAGAFVALADRLEWALSDSPSGRELRSRGWDDDVRAAAQHSVSSCVPVIEGDRFVDGSRPIPSMRE